MNENRETQKINTPSGVEVVMYTYATGREARQIEQKYLSAIKVDIQSGNPTFKDFDTSSPYEAEKEAIKLLVISVNNKTENMLDTLLDLPQSDYEFVVSHINEITKKKS